MIGIRLSVVALPGRSPDYLGAALGLLGQGAQPFPWQQHPLEGFMKGALHPALDIPTGLGKTSLEAIWLVARAFGAPWLVYVVNRRAVVDQTTEVAESHRAWVAKERTAVDAPGLGDETR